MMGVVKLVLAAPLLAAVALTGARFAREEAKASAIAEITDPPYAPSASSAPMLTLGYRELAADLLYVRLTGYFGSQDNEGPGIAALAEAIAALDPQLRRVYEFGAVAMTSARRDVDNSVHMRAIKLLEIGARTFPEYWRFPKLAAEIYIVDLQTDDPAQRRKWDAEGARLLEAATRKPGAPADAAVSVAALRSRLGQQQRAVDSLKETLLTTTDQNARRRLIEKLAELASGDADQIAAEVIEERKRFENTWLHHRPAVRPSMYLLIGPHIEPGFDLAELATGGRDLITADTFERLEPVTDEPPPSSPPLP